MVVYRLTMTKYADDLSGEGSRLEGGRWNQTGVPCVYTAASRALALLEYSVNINIHKIPRALSMVSIKIPDDDIQVFPIANLPGNWTANSNPDSTRIFGTTLLNPPQHLVIQIPSVVIPEEFNYILNPLHPRANELRIVEIADFVYDQRIKTK